MLLNILATLMDGSAGTVRHWHRHGLTFRRAADPVACAAVLRAGSASPRRARHALSGDLLDRDFAEAHDAIDRSRWRALAFSRIAWGVRVDQA
jgi:hypothetical protein